MPTLTILRGMPCSGKSTYTKDRLENPYYRGFSGFNPPVVVSRDIIRTELFNCKYEDYKFSKDNERKVTTEFNLQFEEAIKDKRDIIIDNTNLKFSAYGQYMSYASKAGYDVEFKDFYVPFWKAMYRNIIRKIKTGKWIPYKVMKDFYKRSKILKYA